MTVVKGMTKAELDTFLAERGMAIDYRHEGAGKFRDLYIGIGRPMPELVALAKELRKQIPNAVTIDWVNNAGHPDFNKPFVEVKSFWDD